MQQLKTSHSVRCDRFLMEALSLSRREALLLLKHNRVAIGKRRLSVKHKGLQLEAGTKLMIETYTDLLSDTILPNPKLRLNLLTQGDGYVIVDKPAGMPVMPLQNQETMTVLNALVHHHPELQGVGEAGLRSGVVHRLDTNPSGALIVATEEAIWQTLRKAFKTHQIEKQYRAIVQGQLKGSGKESMFLYVAQHKPAKVRVSDEARNDSRLCTLRWESLEIFDDASLLSINLETGFLHQIRAMFSHKGYPVLGDKHYAGGSTQAKRQMLHASYLHVYDIEAHSPDPQDFQTLIKALRS